VELEKYCLEHKAVISGGDEAGGSTAHLSVRGLPSGPGVPVYAFVRLAERPPGTESIVGCLYGCSILFLWLQFILWNSVMKSADTRGVDIANLLFVALPGFASLWFSRAFQVEYRPSLSLLSRLALLVTGVSAAYALMTVLWNRVAGNHGAQGEWFAMLSRGWLLVVAILASLLLPLIVRRRLKIHRQYQALQQRSSKRYFQSTVAPVAIARDGHG
jgi:hypothetical protein